MQEQKEQPLFSIIMPCYNSEAYIETAVNSVRAQLFPLWELIAVNDGSTDRTEELLQSYAQADPRIRVFSKSNGGYCSAVNTGLKQIRGKYFLLMGSDDKLFSNLLQDIVQAMADSDPDLIGFRTIRYRDGENLGLDQYTAFCSLIQKNDTTIKAFEKENPEDSKIFFIRDTSKVFQSSLLGQLEYFGKFGFDADGIFSMLLAHRAHSFMLVPIDGYAWTLRNESVSSKSKMPAALYHDRLNNWKQYYSVLSKMDKSELTKHDRYYIDYYYDLLWQWGEVMAESGFDDSDWKHFCMHGRFLFRIMRHFRVSVGNTMMERIRNYFHLIFPKTNRAVFTVNGGAL